MELRDPNTGDTWLLHPRHQLMTNEFTAPCAAEAPHRTESNKINKNKCALIILDNPPLLGGEGGG